MRRLIAVVVALLLAIGVWAPTLAEDDGTVSVEVRVWQNTITPSHLYVSARPAGGSWQALGTVRLRPDERGSSDDRKRYNRVTVLAPLAGDGLSGPAARVEIVVEQEVDGGGFFVAARGEGHFPGETEAAALSLGERSEEGWYRYGDITFELAVSVPSQRHLEPKRFMLELINAARAEAGANPVTLGENDAAQLHGEASLVGCYSSHWGIDGLKPYMRYTLTGGHQANAENGLGLDYCITAADSLRAIVTVEREIQEAMESLLASSGHAANILNPRHRAVSIGLAWDRYNFRAVQHFEGDYIEYEHLPSIEDGRLDFSGTVKNGVWFAEENDLRVGIRFDPPPYELTLGQVTRTYCSGNGPAVAGLRRPLPATRSYRSDEFTQTYRPCPDPYDVDPEAPAPASPVEANAFWESARADSAELPDLSVTVPWVTAEAWTASEDAFSIRADLSEVLAEHGPGVYTVLLWGNIGGEFVAISRYSVFHGVEPPEGYLQHR